jgi:hypothetical protein
MMVRPDTAVVGDAKEPPSDILPILKIVQLAIGLEQDVLHDVFTIENGPGHAAAVAMQLGTVPCNSLYEPRIAGVELAST